MWEMKRILCPIDFSEFSVKAFDYAQSLARHYDARLLLQHVVQPLFYNPNYSVASPVMFDQIQQGLRADSEKRLDDFVKAHIISGVQAERVVQEGFPTECILSLAEAQSVDLIVMGTHGLRGFDRLVLGSVAERILRKAGCPVLAVRKPAHDFVSPEQKGDAVGLQKILFCTDFSDYAHRALQYALSLAVEYQAELTLLHVLEEPPGSRDMEITMKEVADKLEALAPPQARKSCSIKTAVRVGKPYEKIVQHALEDQTDLIVMGVLGRSAVDLLVFGSVTHRVIQLGSCPVLAVRGYSWRF